MFTVIIPVYNEEAILVENTNKLIAYLDGLKKPYEIIICSNGSTDSTDELGRKLEINQGGRVRFFSIPEKGVGRAFKKGVEASRSDQLLSIDMDLTTDLGFIEKALELFDEHDIIIGSKKVGEQNRSVWRLFISGGFILLVRALLGLKYSDYSIGSKAYRKSVIEKWLPDIDHGSAYVIELIYRAKKKGYQVIEVPVFCDDRRKSRFNLIHEIIYRFENLIKLWLTEGVFNRGP